MLDMVGRDMSCNKEEIPYLLQTTIDIYRWWGCKQLPSLWTVRKINHFQVRFNLIQESIVVRLCLFLLIESTSVGFCFLFFSVYVYIDIFPQIGCFVEVFFLFYEFLLNKIFHCCCCSSSCRRCSIDCVNRRREK